MVCFTLGDAIKTGMTTYINREAKQTEEQSNMKSTWSEESSQNI